MSKGKLIVVSWLLFIVLTLMVMFGLLKEIDLYFISNVPEFEGVLLHVLFFLSFIANIYTVFSIVIIIFLYNHFKRKNVKWGLALFLSIVFVSIAAFIVKNVTAIPRPYNIENAYPLTVESYSYPSGHVSRFTVICYYLSKKFKHIRLLMIFLLILIAFSRILLLQHYVSDVLGGFLLGLALSLSTEIILEYRRYSAKY